VHLPQRKESLLAMKKSNQWSLPDHVMPQKYCVVPQALEQKLSV